MYTTSTDSGDIIVSRISKMAEKTGSGDNLTVFGNFHSSIYKTGLYSKPYTYRLDRQWEAVTATVK